MSNLKFSETAVLFFMLLCGFVWGKECTNVPTKLSSHTFRYNLLTSSNDSWRSEVYAQRALFASSEGILPRKILGEANIARSWAMLYQTVKDGAIQATQNHLKEVSLHDVRLDWNSIHGRAQKTNLEYLLMLDVDSLVWSFRKTAGFPTIGDPYGGWESPKVELRGHFVGHFLSASALMWASTHNDILEKKMSAVVSVLSLCQEKMGTGYLSAFPSEELDRFEDVRPVWAPYYTLHKIMAGLLDQYVFAFNDHALKMATWMADYFYERVQNVITKFSIERHYLSLNEETGGMNDVLYRLFKITANEKHALLASLFDKPCFLGLLAVKADDISRFHANTHIPIVIGSQMRYETTGDTLHKQIGVFFMKIINASHTYATGGVSVSEFWTDPNRLATTLQSENEESCTTYNMLKVSRNLFKWTGDASHAEYYERALTNGVLSIQRGAEPGIMIYMLPLGRGVSKAESFHGWGTPFNAFWCCYGTGIESFSKLGDSIYFEKEGNQPTLYIIQYISSTLEWKSAEIQINQTVGDVFSWDPYLRVMLTFSSKHKANDLSFIVNLRIPAWSSAEHSAATINGQKLSLHLPGNFFSVIVKPEDTVTLKLPIRLRIEPIKDDRPEYSSLHAILFGNYLLVGMTSNKGDADIRADPSASVSEWVTPIGRDYNHHLLSLVHTSGNSSFVFTKSVDRGITLQKIPEPGTDAAMHATFRLIPKNEDPSKFLSPLDAIGELVSLEPFDRPKMLVGYQSNDQGLLVVDQSSENVHFVFRLVHGLDERNGTVSLKAESYEGCYAVAYYGSVNDVKIGCSEEPYDDKFKQVASFEIRRGLREYHPISFVAMGAKENFILEPLLSLRDEHYTVYFSVKA